MPCVCPLPGWRYYGRTTQIRPYAPVLLQQAVNLGEDLLIREMPDLGRTAGTVACATAAALTHGLIDLADALIGVEFNGAVGT